MKLAFKTKGLKASQSQIIGMSIERDDFNPNTKTRPSNAYVGELNTHAREKRTSQVDNFHLNK